MKTEYQITFKNLNITVAEFLAWLETCSGPVDINQYMRELEDKNTIPFGSFNIWCSEEDLIYFKLTWDNIKIVDAKTEKQINPALI
jgi:hypothetical protein